MRTVFENKLDLFSIFLFFSIFVLVVFVFKTSSQTLSYSNKTCFAVLKTENLFSKQQPNRLSVFAFLFSVCAAERLGAASLWFGL
jgi:hypothetical protein